MKKTLVAIAALAATGAFAQSAVTLTGNIDFAAANVTGTQYGVKGSTVSTTTGTSSTSVINITAVEDLGAGMKVTGKYGLDPRTLANDSYAVSNNIVASGTDANANTATGLARDEVFVGLAGNFGNLRLGAPNALGLEASGDSSPLGTGVGSAYAPVASTMFNSVVTTRYNRSARYDSPTISGFTASLQYAPGNDEANFQASSLNVARIVPNARKATEIGLKYSNGPLNVTVVNIKTAAQTNATGWYAASSAGATAAINYVETSGNIFAANYNFGSTTVYVGKTSGEANTSTTSALTAKGTRLAVKQTVGSVDLIAQLTKQQNGTAAEQKVTGLRADYNLSKTAAAYVGYEKWDTGTTASSNATGDRKIVSAGLRKSF